MSLEGTEDQRKDHTENPDEAEAAVFIEIDHINDEVSPDYEANEEPT